MTFAQTIRAKRESLGLTQAEFAAKLMVSKQTVNNWECGRSEPWPGTKMHVLEQLGSEVMPAERFSNSKRPADRKPLRATGAYQRKRQPSVCEELEASEPRQQEIVAGPKIDFRRPPPHG